MRMQEYKDEALRIKWYVPQSCLARSTQDGNTRKNRGL